MKNKFIVIEGCDGSGKSSIASGLAKKINGVYFKTPTKIFWDIRGEIEKEKNYDLIFYFYLTGTLHAADEIKEILKTKHVVCDRYFYTTIAYHRSLGVKIPNEIENLFLPADHVFCLHANETITKARMAKRKDFGPHDLNYELQMKVFREFRDVFHLELIDTSYNILEESINNILQKINF